MKYADLVKKCKEVSAKFSCCDYLNDKSEKAKAIRAKAAAEVRDWLQAYNLQTVNVGTRCDKIVFEDKNEYLHTAFYATGIYTRYKDATQKQHTRVSAKEYQKRQSEAAPIEEGANFFIDLFRSKEKAEAEAKAKAEAKKVLADEIKAKDEEIKALKKLLAAKKSAAKATAKKKAAK